MTKSQALQLFGGRVADLADALDMTRQGVYQWPDELTPGQADRVRGAALRLGLTDRLSELESGAAA
jgi:hypothetical protein